MIQVPDVADDEIPQRLCGLDDIPESGAISIEKELFGQQQAFIVTRADGVVSAYHNLCPHAGRRLDWAPGKFLLKDRVLVCAVHGASFRIETGLCIGGPCRGEHLRRVGVDVVDEVVMLTDL